MFGDVTEIFAADGYQFLKMREFLETIEAKAVRTDNEMAMLNAFNSVARLCRYFLDRNPKV